MKYVIADSGSTKTEWVLVGEEGTQTVFTAGINPVHMTAGEIESILNREFTLSVAEVRVVWFYGAGCIPAACDDMGEIMRGFFRTDHVFVGSDLLGAAKGSLGDRPGVACILGTGSNSALYDGGQIVWNVPPLGYVLGDEGSGADLGKRLIGNLLKGLLPKEIEKAFYSEYPLDYTGIIGSVYRQSGANRFLAGFCPFLCKHLDHPAVRSLVERAFADFTERNLLAYEGIRELPVTFTGSVAHYFEEPLRDVLGRYGLTIGKIDRSPVPGLIRYHQMKMQQP